MSFTLYIRLVAEDAPIEAAILIVRAIALVLAYFLLRKCFECFTELMIWLVDQILFNCWHRITASFLAQMDDHCRC